MVVVMVGAVAVAVAVVVAVVVVVVYLWYTCGGIPMVACLVGAQCFSMWRVY